MPLAGLLLARRARSLRVESSAARRARGAAGERHPRPAGRGVEQVAPLAQCRHPSGHAGRAGPSDGGGPGRDAPASARSRCPMRPRPSPWCRWMPRLRARSRSDPADERPPRVRSTSRASRRGRTGPRSPRRPRRRATCRPLGSRGRRLRLVFGRARDRRPQRHRVAPGRAPSHVFAGGAGKRPSRSPPPTGGARVGHGRRGGVRSLPVGDGVYRWRPRLPCAAVRLPMRRVGVGVLPAVARRPAAAAVTVLP